MRILEGSLQETIYNKPGPEDIPGTPLKIKQETTFSPGQVAYISDKIGLHRVCNPDPKNIAISLHCKARLLIPWHRWLIF
jgi:cysteine dioxygenase